MRLLGHFYAASLTICLALGSGGLASAADSPVPSQAPVSQSQKQADTERAYVIDPKNDAEGTKACTTAGGVVATAKGIKYCVGGTSTPLAGITTFERLCMENNGIVATDTKGKKHCVVTSKSTLLPAQPNS